MWGNRAAMWASGTGGGNMLRKRLALANFGMAGLFTSVGHAGDDDTSAICWEVMLAKYLELRLAI
jgi:hypothetical protein